MSDNGDAPTLSVNHQGFVFWDDVRLPVRYVRGNLEFVLKRPQDRERLQAKRVKVPLVEFAKLEQRRPQAQIGKRQATAKDLRAARRAVNISRRNNLVDKTG